MLDSKDENLLSRLPDETFLDKLVFAKPRSQHDLALGPLGGSLSVNELRLKVDDKVTLQGWRGKHMRNSRNDRILLYFGGRSEDVFWFPKVASYIGDWYVYSFNYRGFGRSRGESSEATAKKDAMAIYEYISYKHGNTEFQLALMGRSLGTNIATWLATKVPTDQLLLLSPFRNATQVLLHKASTIPLAKFFADKLRSSDRTHRVKANVSVIVAERDTLIPVTESLAFANDLPGGSRTYLIPRTDHNSLPRSPQTLEVIKKILTGEDSQPS